MSITRKYYAISAGIFVVTASYMSPAYASEEIDATHNATLKEGHEYETIKPTDTGEGILYKGWKFQGDLRAGYVLYDYSNDPRHPDPDINMGHMDSKGFYTSAKLSLTTPKYNGVYAKLTGAGITDLGINDPLYETRTFAFGESGEPFAIITDAYLAYDDNGQKILIGAEEVDTPLIESDDYYFLANSFQLAYYKNTTFKDIMFGGGYFYKMAGVWDSGADGAHYHTMVDASYVDPRDKANASDGGIYMLNFQYSNDAHNLQAWNYYTPDLYNMFLLQYDYTGKQEGFSYEAGIQLINFSQVGALADHDYTTIDYSIYSARLDAELDQGFDVSVAAMFFTDGEGPGATLGAWGGYPYFATGMIFSFFDPGSMQNANIYKFQVGYNMRALGLENLWGGIRYTYFDLDPAYSISSFTGIGEEKMANIGAKVTYKHSSGINVSALYEHADLDQQPGIHGFRVIAGYKF